MRNNRKTYSEMILMSTFDDRFNYLKLQGGVGMDTFGFDRYMNQQFYRSKEWKDIRHKVIVRDNGCDLGIPGRSINGKIVIHHINPISPIDIEDSTSLLLDMDNLVCVSMDTHNAIHYGDISLTKRNEVTERTPNDTCPWKIAK